MIINTNSIFLEREQRVVFKEIVSLKTFAISSYFKRYFLGVAEIVNNFVL